MKTKKSLAILVAVAASILVLAASAVALHADAVHRWSEEESAVLRTLWLGSLPTIPPDPSNRVAGDPRAVAFGKKLFFDASFSGNARVSCSTCHGEKQFFTDNLPLAHGMGFTGRRSMPLAGTAYSPWLFWDGRADSLWSQALGPLESPVEHGISRTFSARIIRDKYRVEYEAIFGAMPELPDELLLDLARPSKDFPAAQMAWESIPEMKRKEITGVYVNIGKSIAAYVRRIQHGKSRFDQYVEALFRGDDEKMSATFTPVEAEGLRLFIGKARCINCHNGPLFTNNDFHNVGVADNKRVGPDAGRADGIKQVIASEFNCLGPYSDAKPRDCAELRFIDDDAEKYRGFFKTPSLRNVADRPPYMHAGQLPTLAEVLDHYSTVRPGGRVSPELGHTGLSADEMAKIEAFMHTLSGPVIAP